MRVFMFLMLLIGGVQAEIISSNPALESQVRKLSSQIRCLSCEGQTIEDNKSVFAEEVRATIRQALVRGDTATVILNKIHEKYGDNIFLIPPMRMDTYVLWYGPFGILLIGLFCVLARFKRNFKQREEPDQIHTMRK